MMNEHQEHAHLSVTRKLSGEEQRVLLRITFFFSQEPTKDEHETFGNWLKEKFSRKCMNDLMHIDPTDEAIAHLLEGVGSLFFWGDAELMAVSVESK